MASTTCLIPTGYTFLNSKTFLSSKAKDIVIDLLKKADNRNPDAFDMYIYNDFFNYALLDLVDKTLSAIHTKIVKKDWTEAIIHLEALGVFQDIESSWPMCDDGHRTKLTNVVYGASLVTVLRALKKEGRLDTTHLPSLETILRTAAEWGVGMKGAGARSDYYLVCKAIGRRLFKDKSPEVHALEKARVDEWINSLDAEDQGQMRERMKKDVEDAAEAAREGHVEEPWYEGCKASDEDDDDDDFVLSRTWKKYKGYLSSAPTKPLRGPANWDISKWSEVQKAAFKFDNMDDSD